MKVELDMVAVEAVKAALGDLKDSYKKVLTTAINKTLSTAKTQAKARIGNELNLKASRIEEDLTLDKANYTNMSGRLTATGEPVGLMQFGARTVNQGVSVQVLKSNPRSTIRHAFIARGKNSSTEHVFWRKTRMPGSRFTTGKPVRVPWQQFGTIYRLPLERLTGPRIEDIFAQPKVLDPVTIQANHLFLANVDTQISEVIRRHNLAQ